MPRLVGRSATTTQISPQHILRYELLRLPSSELAAHLRELSYANPLLEVVEHGQCPRCGQPLPSGERWSLCRACRREEAALPARHASVGEGEGGDGWIERVSRGESGLEALWRQCVEGAIPACDRAIACHLLADLDEHGFLASAPAEHAAGLALPLARVERVRQALMRLEPLGIASRDSRECLLVQVEGRSDAWAAPLHRLLQEGWPYVVEGELGRAARHLGIPLAELHLAFDAMLQHLSPYPTSGLRASGREGLLPDPDVHFLRPAAGSWQAATVEVLGGRRFAVALSSEYRPLLRAPHCCDGEARSQLGAWVDEVRRVARALRQRWETLQQVCESIVEFQREFFVRDEFSLSVLRPLTREEVAAAVGVHPSTVGRAVQDKFAALPDRRIVPLSLFFDSRAPVQAMIAALIRDEQCPLSDETLRAHLHRAGWRMSRRAVAMHRDSLGILPTHLRRRRQRLAARR